MLLHRNSEMNCKRMHYLGPLGTVRPIYRTATLCYNPDVAFYIFFQQI
jgi:hypothetical protein